MTFARIHGWLRAHPLAGDAALAGVVLICMIVGSFADPHGSNGPVFGTRTPSVTALVLAVLGAVSLVLRRRNPLAVLGLTGAVTVADLLAGNSPAPIAISPVVALYTVAAHTDRPTTYRVGITTMAVLTATAMCFGDAPWYAQENVAVLAWTGLAATAGDAVRSRRAIVESIRERAERAERTREEEARRRVAEERLRIARDLHDVVAHHIALVNVQAGVAAHVMDKRPDQAKEALAHVREASRSALNELRATVGLLRQSGDPEAPTEPAPASRSWTTCWAASAAPGSRSSSPPRRGRPRRAPGGRGPRRVPGDPGGAHQRTQTRGPGREGRGQRGAGGAEHGDHGHRQRHRERRRRHRGRRRGPRSARDARARQRARWHLHGGTPLRRRLPGAGDTAGQDGRHGPYGADPQGGRGRPGGRGTGEGYA